ncbi:uncharacterized protein LOC109411980 [Aedes albopictus]|uniref:Uncharacterized protein n=1 Tax=Aedes albopictus TaxID=7160 RepID=A0ABM1ZL94_AEDAL
MTGAPPSPSSPPLRSVHFTDSASLARQTFSPLRYNVPLFVYKKLTIPGVERRDELRVLANGRRQLLRRMLKTTYGELPNCEDHINVNLEPNSTRTWDQQWQKQPSEHVHSNPSKSRCPKSLRNGHKDWTLAPNRYRLANNISDSASKSTGTKGPYQCFTGERFSLISRVAATHGGPYRNEELGGISLPAEMDRLGHPKRYFVGKIRPGDKNKQRAYSRLALSQPTLCWRNPLEPGPNHYFKGIFDIPPKKVPPIVTGHCQQRLRMKQLIAGPLLPPTPSVHHSYCAEPFRRPPPGRYQLPTSIPMPKPALSIAPHRRRIAVPARYDFSYNFAWNPYRQPATLLMHTVDIPVRRRKRGRNMKVAFGSATARFKDQEFFPIGALKSVLPKDAKKRPNRAAGGANQKIVSTAAVVAEKTGMAADTVEKTPSANLGRTRTKLFVIPRKHQTKWIPSMPDVVVVAATVPNGTDQSASRESSVATSTALAANLDAESFGDGASNVMETEVIVRRESI